MEKLRVAVIGATGLVGKTFLKIIDENNEQFDIKLFASSKSEGKIIKVNNKNYIVHTLNQNSFDEVDYALFFTSSLVSSSFIPIALSKNVKVIDNSSCYRMNPNVKLIAYGANENILNKNDFLVSNPNCAVIQSIVLVSLLKDLSINKVIYNTYQSVSGSGKKGIDDLLRCRKGIEPKFYESDISFTCIPKIGKIEDNSFTDEENKMINETKKILNNDKIDVLSTCVRVPVMFSHGVSVIVKINEEFTIKQIVDRFNKNKNVIVCNKEVPTSILSCKNDKIYVGRIRKQKDYLLFYCVADNLRVGAATNSYNILKRMIKLGEDY